MTGWLKIVSIGAKYFIIETEGNFLYVYCLISTNNNIKVEITIVARLIFFLDRKGKGIF